MLVVSKGEHYERVALLGPSSPYVFIESTEGFVKANREGDMSAEEWLITTSGKWQPLFSIETIRLG
jgi:hypothetical protein